MPRLVGLLGERDPALRWWGALGLAALKEKATAGETALRKALGDDSPEVRVAAAEALSNLGHDAEALPALGEALGHESVFVRLAALQAAYRLGRRARPLLPAIARAKLSDPRHKDVSNYVGRMVDYLPGRIGE